MSQLPTCCEFHKKTECGQGDNCPARNRTCPIATTYAETEGVMTMPTGCSTKALPDPAKQPLPVIPVSDAKGHAAHLVKWLSITVFFVASAALVAGFFNH